MKLVSKKFEYYLTGKRVFFTSDIHFGAQRTLELSRRPFKDVSEMNERILSNFKNAMTEDDVLIDLGDRGDFNIELPGGLKFFLRGNYEPSGVELPEDYIEIFYDDYLELDDGTKFYFTHEPDRGTWTQESIPKFYLFGHVHQLSMIKRNGLNVGVDCHHFQPVSVETILFYKNAIYNHYDHNVFQSFVMGSK